MPALTEAAGLKTNSDFSLPLRLMDFSFQSRTLLSDGINHKIPHFKSMISWRTTAHFISYQEIGQISHISRIKWHFRKFIWTKNEVSSLQTPISLKAVSDENFQNNWELHKKIHICMYMTILTHTSHTHTRTDNIHSHTHRHTGFPTASASHPVKQYKPLILVISINSKILKILPPYFFFYPITLGIPVGVCSLVCSLSTQN